MTQKDRVYLCPSCGSPAVDFSVIASSATCRKCGWDGDGRDVLEQSFQHAHGSQEEVLQAFTKDFRNTFAAAAAGPVAKILMKWGFLGIRKDPQALLARYMTAAAKGMVHAILLEREKIEKES